MENIKKISSVESQKGVMITPFWFSTDDMLSLFKDILFRTRRALSLYKVYGNSALLVLNGT